MMLTATYSKRTGTSLCRSERLALREIRVGPAPRQAEQMYEAVTAIHEGPSKL